MRSAWRFPWVLLAVTVLGGAGWAGCGAATGAGYLNESTWTATHQVAAIAFVQLTAQGSTLSGTFDETYFMDPSEMETSALHLSVSGTEDGDQVTLTLSGGLLFGSGTVSGTLSGGELTLEMPQSDGSLQSDVFSTADVAAYDDDVQTMQGLMASAQASAAAASASASAVAAQAALGNAVAGANETVEEDISALDAIGAVDTSALSADLQDQQQDVTTMRSDEAVAEAASSSDEQCSDADTVVSDADTVQSDADSVQSDVDGIQSDISQLADAITTTKQDFSALQAAEGADPSYSGEEASQQQVAAAEAQVQAVITTATNTANADLAQAQSVAASAATEASNFDNEYCG
jgi:hypothetical protein